MGVNDKVGQWSLKSGEELPQDVQDTLNDAVKHAVNNNGMTLEEAMHAKSIRDRQTAEVNEVVEESEIRKEQNRLLTEWRKEKALLRQIRMGYVADIKSIEEEIDKLTKNIKSLEQGRNHE